MGILDLGRRWFSICVAAGSLTACGGSQPSIRAPSATTQANDNASSLFQVLHRFGRHAEGGAVPQSPLLNFNGTLYGTTLWSHPCHHHGCGNGTVFSITKTGLKKVLYNFKGGIADGAQPIGPLIDVNGTLYGTTEQGGGSGCDGRGCGTIYSLSTTGSEKVLHSFEGGSDGAEPNGVIDVNGTLYGTTSLGGSGVNCGGSVDTPGCGTVYSISTSGSETVLHAFAGIPDGALPNAALIDVNGTLYGTTGSGGVECGTQSITFTQGCGTVYSITTSGSENVLYRFKGHRLAAVIPVGGLLDIHGMLYGTTSSGFAAGSVYKISLSGAHKIVYYFRGIPDGALPSGGLISVNGLLYGTTQSGGVACMKSTDRGCGTVFSVTTGGSETVLHSFTGGSIGAYPHALTDINNTLYGTTESGGYPAPGCDAGCGIVFSLTI
jgi:uncharacterized repeat protein (TIGR03803 family)